MQQEETTHLECSAAFFRNKQTLGDGGAEADASAEERSNNKQFRSKSEII